MSMGPLLTPQEVAATLKVKIARVYEAVHDRRLRAVKVGRLLRFRPQDIEAFLDRHTTARK
jgi:excisionase family DNA binding protein